MHDFHKLAQTAMIEYRYQPGLIAIQADGGAGGDGLRYVFEDEDSAERFLTLRSLLHSREGGSNELYVEGCHVVEVWV